MTTATAPARPAAPEERRGATLPTATTIIAVRTVKKFVRTPQLVVAGTLQNVMFLLIFRYVFGGAIGHTGAVSYVDYLVPGFVVTGVLFSGMGAATGVAEDLESGVVDRFRSLPLPSVAVVCGRVLGDMTMLGWGLAASVGVGFAVGFRLHAGVGRGLAALGLCLVWGFAFTWLFVTLGYLARTPQAAQGLAFLVFPLTFVSSAYVPVATMPGWMQAFARHQPLSFMSSAARILTEGPAAGHGLTSAVVGSLVWAAAIVAVCVPVTAWRLRRA
jgi:ABC-2 type transport system permease protein